MGKMRKEDGDIRSRGTQGEEAGIRGSAESGSAEKRGQCERKKARTVNFNITASGLSSGGWGLSGLEPLGPLETGRRLVGLACVAQSLPQVSLGPRRIGAQADRRSKVRDGFLQPTG